MGHRSVTRSSSEETETVSGTGTDLISPNIVTPKRLWYVAIVTMSIMLGAILPWVPGKFQPTLLMLVPLFIGCFLIIMNPFIGVCGYVMYEYIRPDSFISALRILKPAILLEALTLVGLLVHIIKTKEYPRWIGFNWLYLSFIIVVMLSGITASNNSIAFELFRALLINFTIFIMATTLLNSVERVHKFMWLLLIIHFYFALKSIQTGGLVGGALMGDENDLALSLNIVIPFAFFMFVESKLNRIRIIGLAALLALLFGVVASMSRGGFVGMVVGVFFCIAISKRKVLNLIITLCVIAVIVPLIPQQYIAEIQTITNTHEATAESRLNYWKAAYNMYLDHIIIGVGPGNGPYMMPEYYVFGVDNPEKQWGRTFHGTLPQVLAELGSLGILIYLILIVVGLKLLFTVRRRCLDPSDGLYKLLANSILGGFVAYNVTAVFLSTAYYPQLWTLYIAAIALYKCFIFRKDQPFTKPYLAK